MPASYRSEGRCRICASKKLLKVLDYGRTPLADRLLDGDDILEEDLIVPLNLVWCPECALLQITETVPSSLLFDDRYPYFSSTSRTRLDDCRKFAGELIETLALTPRSRVVEVASNDGYMLTNFRNAGIPVLGIEPAAAPASEARRRGIPTIGEFLDEALAHRLVADGWQADLVLAANVVAHAPDPHGFVRALATILKPGGTLVIEVQYAPKLLEGNAFDTVYHQHLCYFSLGSLGSLAASCALTIFDARIVPAQGGSLLALAGHDRHVTPMVTRLLDAEKQSGIHQPVAYEAFSRRAYRLREEISSLMRRLRRGGRIAAYGAAAKGTTLLHFCRLDSSIVDYVVDLNAFKQGKRLPGNRLPIVHPDRLIEDRPDFLLLLVWNLKEEILEQLATYREAGGRIVVPLPSPEVL